MTHLFSVCTPYSPPSNRAFIPIEDLVATYLPNFGYQLQFKSEEVEKQVRTKQDIRSFLLAAYNAKTTSGELAINVRKGLLFDKFGDLQMSPFVTEEVSYIYKYYYIPDWFEFGDLSIPRN